MSGFKALSQAINPEAYKRSRMLSVPLSRLGGEMAYHRTSVGLHFIAEHPKNSDQ